MCISLVILSISILIGLNSILKSTNTITLKGLYVGAQPFIGCNKTRISGKKFNCVIGATKEQSPAISFISQNNSCTRKKISTKKSSGYTPSLATSYNHEYEISCSKSDTITIIYSYNGKILRKSFDVKMPKKLNLSCKTNSGTPIKINGNNVITTGTKIICNTTSGVTINANGKKQTLSSKNKTFAITYNSIKSDKVIVSKTGYKTKNINFKVVNKYQILVNKCNKISKDDINNYKLVNFTNEKGKNQTLEKETYNQYVKLKKAVAKEAPRGKNYYFIATYTYRTFQTSDYLYKKYPSTAAPAGASEHNIGLAIDFVISTNKNSNMSNSKTDEYKVLIKLAPKYGFIVRYPVGKENITGYENEVWHLRYVGKKLATKLKNKGITLEEYYKKEYNKEKENYKDQCS